MTRPRPRIIAVFGGKGGIGKTTTASCLAWLFGRDQGETLLVDANADQPSATEIYEQLQTDATYTLTTEKDPAKLGRLTGVPFEWVVVDCPPSPTEAAAALDAADIVLVPFQPRWLETRAIMRTLRALATRPYRVLFVAIAHNKKGVARASREALTGLEIPLFTTEVRRYDAHEFSQGSGWPVFTPEARQRITHADRCDVDYTAVRDELLTLPELTR